MNCSPGVQRGIRQEPLSDNFSPSAARPWWSRSGRHERMRERSLPFPFAPSDRAAIVSRGRQAIVKSPRPISRDARASIHRAARGTRHERLGEMRDGTGQTGTRSEEHTSELQSLMRTSYAVFSLKKKKQKEHKPN